MSCDLSKYAHMSLTAAQQAAASDGIDGQAFRAAVCEAAERNWERATEEARALMPKFSLWQPAPLAALWPRAVWLPRIPAERATEEARCREFQANLAWVRRPGWWIIVGATISGAPDGRRRLVWSENGAPDVDGNDRPFRCESESRSDVHDEYWRVVHQAPDGSMGWTPDSVHFTFLPRPEGWGDSA